MQSEGLNLNHRALPENPIIFISIDKWSVEMHNAIEKFTVIEINVTLLGISSHQERATINQLLKSCHFNDSY